LTGAWGGISLTQLTSKSSEVVSHAGDFIQRRLYIGIKNKRLANEAGLKAGPSEMQMDEQTRKLVAEALLAAMK